MNILYIDYGNTVSEHNMYQYYGDLYRELSKNNKVFLHQGPINNVEAINYSIIDCIIFGLGYFTQTDPETYKEIKGLKSLKIPVVCMLHKHLSLLEEKLQFCKINNIDILVDSHITYRQHGEFINSKSFRCWFTADSNIYYPRPVEKKYDIGFSGADHGGDKIKGPTNDLRNRVKAVLQKTDYNLFWNSTRDLSYRISSVEDYATKINESRIWLATTGPSNDISPRYFEVMLSKTLLLCNNMPYEYEGVFIDGENCVMFENDLSNLTEKLDYYLNNQNEMNRIIENAYNNAIKNYTCEQMSNKLLELIQELR